MLNVVLIFCSYKPNKISIYKIKSSISTLVHNRNMSKTYKAFPARILVQSYTI